MITPADKQQAETQAAANEPPSTAREQLEQFVEAEAAHREAEAINELTRRDEEEQQAIERARTEGNY